MARGGRWRDSCEDGPREQTGPYSQAVGISSPPQMQFFDVHNFLTPAV